MLNKFMIAGILGCMVMTQGVLGEYHNTIVNVREMRGARNYSIILSFEQSSPILNYAPESFSESLDDHVYRCFLPYTNLHDDFQNTIPEMLNQVGLGVELVLKGKFLRKFVGTHKILIQMKAEGV